MSTQESHPETSPGTPTYKMLRDQTYKVICDLVDLGTLATMDDIVRITKVDRATANEAVKTLKAQGLIYAHVRGAYRPVSIHPPSRPTSRTILRDGSTKMEMGDYVIHLTPEEARTWGVLLGGSAAEVSAVEGGRAMAAMASLLEVRMTRLEKLANLSLDLDGD